MTTQQGSQLALQTGSEDLRYNSSIATVFWWRSILMCPIVPNYQRANFPLIWTFIYDKWPPSLRTWLLCPDCALFKQWNFGMRRWVAGCGWRFFSHFHPILSSADLLCLIRGPGPYMRRKRKPGELISYLPNNPPWGWRCLWGWPSVAGDPWRISELCFNPKLLLFLKFVI